MNCEVLHGGSPPPSTRMACSSSDTWQGFLSSLACWPMTPTLQGENQALAVGLQIEKANSGERHIYWWVRIMTWLGNQGQPDSLSRNLSTHRNRTGRRKVLHGSLKLRSWWVTLLYLKIWWFINNHSFPKWWLNPTCPWPLLFISYRRNYYALC